MPLLKLQTSAALSDESRNDLLASLSKIMAETTGKPERYVMVTVTTDAVLMSGQSGPAAFADVRSIGGLNSEVNQRLSQQICQTLKSALGIPPERVYLNFTDVPADAWGWNGGTFG